MMSQRYYSNVYWHFTGSPTNLDGMLLTKPADIGRHGQLKSLDEATAVLLQILRERNLMATSVEKISNHLQTERFCCVTDIPLKDLPVHAAHYGRVAVGFKATAIHHRFVPVLYLSKDNLPMQAQLLSLPDEQTMPGHCQARKATSPQTSPLPHPFLNFIKMTDFGMDAQRTFYSEREWRHLGDFRFETQDIEAVIAPAEKLPQLRACLFEKLGYPSTLSLFAWEFLENA